MDEWSSYNKVYGWNARPLFKERGRRNKNDTYLSQMKGWNSSAVLF